MAAVFYQNWLQNRQANSRACALSGKYGRLFFDNGENVEVASLIPVSLEELAALHGFKIQSRKQPGGVINAGYPTSANARQVLAHVISDYAKGSPLSGTIAMFNKLKDDKAKPAMDVNAFFQDNTLPDLAKLPRTNDQRNKWWDFLQKSEWFESFVAEVCVDIDAQLGRANLCIFNDVNVQNNTGRQFQLDVVHLVGSKLGVISCTTEEKDIGRCKEKFFEAQIRARQLGGKLARCCLVTLLNKESAELVQQDLEELWLTQTKSPIVFGRESVVRWHKGDIADLAEWLSEPEYSEMTIESESAAQVSL